MFISDFHRSHACTGLHSMILSRDSQISTVKVFDFTVHVSGFKGEMYILFKGVVQKNSVCTQVRYVHN